MQQDVGPVQSTMMNMESHSTAQTHDTVKIVESIVTQCLLETIKKESKILEEESLKMCADNSWFVKCMGRLEKYVQTE